MVSTVSPKASETPSNPMPTCGKAAASTAAPQPPSTSQAVPRNSAVSLFARSIASSRRRMATAETSAQPRVKWWRLGGAGVVGLVHALRRGGMSGQHICRANRAGREVAAAVRAGATQAGVHAFGAEGAFVGADARLGALRRQVAVAAFAVRSQGQHERLRRMSGQDAATGPSGK